MITCIVCLDRPIARGAFHLCEPCWRTYRRLGSTVYDVIQWAVKRALFAERKRQRREAARTCSKWKGP